MRSRLRSATLFASSLAVVVAGCRKSEVPLQQAPIVDGTLSANDPANANLPPAGDAGGFGGVQQSFGDTAGNGGALPQAARAVQRPSAAGSSTGSRLQAGGEVYGHAASLPSTGSRGAVGSDPRNEAYRSAAEATAAGSGNRAPGPGGSDADDGYAALLDASVPEAQQPPPPLPVYDQPEAPAPDYLWTPGYWNYVPAGYFYVPGAWVAPPFAGALWTPGWWGGQGNGYRWHHGLWGRHVGYYGGINYGFGYVGYGYQGGYWNDNHFLYNRACNRVDPRMVQNTYIRDVTVNNNVYLNTSRISYAGGRGGIERRPAPQELQARREPFLQPMRTQVEQQQLAARNRGQFFQANHGRPELVTVSRPLQADHVFPMAGARLNRPGVQQGVSSLQQGVGSLQQGVGSLQQGRAGGLQVGPSVHAGQQVLLSPSGRGGGVGRQDQQGQQQGGFGVVPVQGGGIGSEQRGSIGNEQRGSIGNEQRGGIGNEQRGSIGSEQRGNIGQEPRGNVGNEPRSTIGLEQRGNVGLEPRSTIGLEQRGTIGLEQRGTLGQEPRGSIGQEQRSPVGTEQRGLIGSEQRGSAGNAARGTIVGTEQRGGAGLRSGAALEQRHGSAAVLLPPQQRQVLDQQRQQVQQQRVFEQRQQVQQPRGLDSRQGMQPREQSQPLSQRPMQPQSPMPTQPAIQQGHAMQPSMQPQRAPVPTQQAPRAETARPAGAAPAGGAPAGGAPAGGAPAAAAPTAFPAGAQGGGGRPR